MDVLVFIMQIVWTAGILVIIVCGILDELRGTPWYGEEVPPRNRGTGMRSAARGVSAKDRQNCKRQR